MENQKIPSNKNFGITLSIFFLLITIYIFINYEKLNLWLLSAWLFFLFLGITNSNLLSSK